MMWNTYCSHWVNNRFLYLVFGILLHRLKPGFVPWFTVKLDAARLISKLAGNTTRLLIKINSNEVSLAEQFFFAFGVIFYFYYSCILHVIIFPDGQILCYRIKSEKQHQQFV